MHFGQDQIGRQIFENYKLGFQNRPKSTLEDGK